MDFKVVWSPEAIEDLEAIAKYIERDSKFYARAVVNKILDVAKNIKCFPKIGRVAPEIVGENIRERFVYSYRVVYQIRGQKILIVAIIHGRQMFESIIERFEK